MMMACNVKMNPKYRSGKDICKEGKPLDMWTKLPGSSFPLLFSHLMDFTGFFI